MILIYTVADVCKLYQKRREQKQGVKRGISLLRRHDVRIAAEHTADKSMIYRI